MAVKSKSKAVAIAKKTSVNKVNRKKVEDWAIQIENAYVKSIQSLITVGKLLIKAKAELSKEEYSYLIKEELRFDESKISKFIKIASNKLITDANNIRDLPAEPSIVYELTFLNPAEFKKAINKGLINPDMSLKEAEELRGDNRQKRPRKDAEDAEYENVTDEYKNNDDESDEDEEEDEEDDEIEVVPPKAEKPAPSRPLTRSEKVADLLDERVQSTLSAVAQFEDALDKDENLLKEIAKSRLGRETLADVDRLIKTLNRLVKRIEG